MAAPMTPEREACLARIRADFERTTHPGWRDSTDLGVLLAEVDRLSAELAAWESAQDAVMALAEDVNAPVTLAQVAKAHVHGLLAARHAAPTS